MDKSPQTPSSSRLLDFTSTFYSGNPEMAGTAAALSRALGPPPLPLRPALPSAVAPPRMLFTSPPSAKKPQVWRPAPAPVLSSQQPLPATRLTPIPVVESASPNAIFARATGVASYEVAVAQFPGAATIVTVIPRAGASVPKAGVAGITDEAYYPCKCIRCNCVGASFARAADVACYKFATTQIAGAAPIATGISTASVAKFAGITDEAHKPCRSEADFLEADGECIAA